ncbi:hypothetical protein MJ1HA_1147 [Metallosphaera sedula]|nr:hypothetical protein MJ1HA_1147 [Metallosphaera sedula]
MAGYILGLSPRRFKVLRSTVHYWGRVDMATLNLPLTVECAIDET